MIDVRIDGVAVWRSSDVRVNEDATPLDVSDTFAGAGSIQFGIPEGVRSKTLLGKIVEVVDSERGTVVGVVKAISGDGVNVSVEALSRLSALVADRSAAPHVGTLESCLLYYFGLCGISSGVSVDASIADIPVTALGWFGNVWAQVKKLCATFSVELTLVEDVITVRPPRLVRATRWRSSRLSWALDDSQLAQTVQGWYYPKTVITNELVVGNELTSLWSVEAGKTHEFDVDLNASLSSVVQPVCVSSVAYDEDSSSVYSVLDGFGDPVSPADWAAGGGSVTVAISDDSRSLHVTIVGPQDRDRAPYSLVGVGLTGDDYSSLRVLGTGVAFTRELYVLPAYAGAPDEIGAEPDNEFWDSWGAAHAGLIPAATRFGTPTKRVAGVLGDLRSLPFGDTAGARLYDDYSEYRIRTTDVDSTFGPTFQAESDTTHADVEAVWAGHTVDEWDAVWAGRPESEFDLWPLTPLGVVTPSPGLYPGSLTFPSSTTFPGA